MRLSVGAFVVASVTQRRGRHSLFLAPLIGMTLFLACTSPSDTQTDLNTVDRRDGAKSSLLSSVIVERTVQVPLTDTDHKLLDDSARSYDEDIATGAATLSQKSDGMEQVRYYVANWRSFLEQYPGKWIVIIAGEVIADDNKIVAFREARRRYPDRQYVITHIPERGSDGTSSPRGPEKRAIEVPRRRRP